MKEIDLPRNEKELDALKGKAVGFKYRGAELEGIVITKTMDWGRTCIRITKTSDQDIIPILEGEHYMGFNDFMIEDFKLKEDLA